MNDERLDLVLAAARPGDADPARLGPAAVRVLARVAVLQGAPAPSPRALRRRVTSALAAAVVLALGMLAPGSREQDDGPAAPAAGVVALGEREVLAALAARRDARLALIDAGAAGRAAVWRTAEGGRPEALRLLRALWRCGEAEHERLVAATRVPALASEALDLLAAEPAAVAARRLGQALRLDPTLEAGVVARLERVALRGGRREALAALVDAGADGRLLAAARAVALGPASVVDEILARLPATAFESEPLVAALRAARPTLGARVAQRAIAGDRLALAWAAAARDPATVPLLLHEAVGEDAAAAERALARLAHVGTTEAWLAVARASGGESGAFACELLATLPFAAVEALEQRALSSTRDRSAALCALAAAGEAGLERLAAMGRRPALMPEVLVALADSPCRGATRRVVELAAELDSPLPVVQALGRRLALGHGDAGGALLALGRQGPRRAALEQLLQAGEHGEWYLALALQDEQLAATARPMAARAAARQPVPAAGGPPRPSVPGRSLRPY